MRADRTALKGCKQMTRAHHTRTHPKVISLKVEPWLRYLNISHQVQIHRLEDIVVGLPSALESGATLAKDLIVIIENIDGGKGYHNIYIVTPEVYAYP
ncbi:unnamed protein product [Rhizophagus irregularis]|uniref:Uncharacterized protein n=1 Tax=Rhizophagus irregularis TaxID=588596 RepID=A0A915ZTA5_9GLOM|nr:unnamed protein product [Rhizophagus irregularis]CAB5390335.1 unnamed protein product [Rhizophagus irregularis]